MRHFYTAALTALGAVTLVGCSSSGTGTTGMVDRPAGITSQTMVGPSYSHQPAGPSEPTANPNATPGITSQSMIGPHRAVYASDPSSWVEPNPAGITSGSMNGPYGPSDDDASTANYRGGPGHGL